MNVKKFDISKTVYTFNNVTNDEMMKLLSFLMGMEKFDVSMNDNGTYWVSCETEEKSKERPISRKGVGAE